MNRMTILGDHMASPSRHDLQITVIRRLEQVYQPEQQESLRTMKDRFAEHQLAASPLATQAMVSFSRMQSTSSLKYYDWTPHERQILNRMVGLFESGNPHFASAHDEVYLPGK